MWRVLAVVARLAVREWPHHCHLVLSRRAERQCPVLVLQQDERLGRGLQGSLGAAAAVVYFRAEGRILEFSGAGNVSLRHLGGRAISFHYAEGVLGGRMRTPTIQSMVMEPTDLVVMHTDGVSDRLSRISVADTRFQKPQDFARAIVGRYGKSHDDASCIVLRCVR